MLTARLVLLQAVDGTVVLGDGTKPSDQNASLLLLLNLWSTMNGLVIVFAAMAASLYARVEDIVPALELRLETPFMDKYESALSNTFRLNMGFDGAC